MQVTPRTIRSWRARGEAPQVATGPDAEEFAKSQHTRGKLPTVYRVVDISSWIFGVGGPGGLPKPLPASAFDPANDRTAQLRRAWQAAKSAGGAVAEKRVRRKLTDVAKFAARLGFASPTAYEGWLARGTPEDELPAEVRAAREAALDPDAPLADDESSERLQLQSDMAIARMRGGSANVVTAERHRAEPSPPPPPHPTPPEPDRRAAAPRRVPDPSPFPPSAITLRNEEWNRRAAELEPIEGF